MNKSTINSVRGALRAIIARGYGRPGLRQLAGLSSKFLRAYNNEGNYEMEVNGELHAVLRILKLAPGVIIDVGANDGEWTQSVLSRRAGQEVHCFEIVPDTFRRLEGRLGRTPGVVLNQLGLGGAEGTIPFFTDPAATELASRYEMPDRPARVEIEVPLTTGDSYVDRHGVGRVAYLKIDVEGMEMEVLEGFRGTLQCGAVAAVQFEHNWAHVLSRHLLGDFVDFFGSFGFEIFRIFPARLVKLDYNYRTSEAFTGNNYLAVARELLPRLG